MQASRIVIVDDHGIMRDGLSALLDMESDFEVVGTAADGKMALERVTDTKPDLVLMDLSMPGTDGASAIELIKRRFPDIGVVVLTFHREDAHIHAALEAGAEGYALRNVAAGRSYLSPSVCSRVVSIYLETSGSRPNTDSPTWELLSSREREVLKLVAEGYKTREIAEYLSLSVKTIEKYRSSMMRKLDLHSVSAVTAYAIANGLLGQ
jgi:DNA-binding NarL/FixJ family response regulator